MRLTILLCTLSFGTLQAQDTLVVTFKDVPCTDEQRAAGGRESPDIADSASSARIDPPRLNAPLPHYDFRPLIRRSPPYWADVTFVVDTTGHADLCTVRVIRSNEPRWTRHVLEHLPAVRYRPAFENGRPRRLFVRQRFTFGGIRGGGGGV